MIFHRNKRRREFLVDESRFRARLWELTLQAEPDSILAIDADEVFEERMKHEVSLIDHEEFEAIEFRLFDFWNGYTHCVSTALGTRGPNGYGCWCATVPERPTRGRLAAFTVVGFLWSCGGQIPVYQSDLRVKHYGWARPEDVRRKYERYRAIEETEHIKSVLYDADQVRVEPWIRPAGFLFT